MEAPKTPLRYIKMPAASNKPLVRSTKSGVVPMTPPGSTKTFTNTTEVPEMPAVSNKPVVRST